MSPFNRFRSLHWVFAGVFLVAYLSGDDGGVLHVWLGYALLAVFVLRFVVALFRVRGFPRLVTGWRQWRESSSTLIGRLLLMALLLASLLTSVSGLAMVDNGKILGWSGTPAGSTALIQNWEEGEESGDAASGWISADGAGDFHEGAANATLLIAGLHVLWVLIYRRPMMQNMIFGAGRSRRYASASGQKAG